MEDFPTLLFKPRPKKVDDARHSRDIERLRRMGRSGGEKTAKKKRRTVDSNDAHSQRKAEREAEEVTENENQWT